MLRLLNLPQESTPPRRRVRDKAHRQSPQRRRHRSYCWFVNRVSLSSNLAADLQEACRTLESAQKLSQGIKNTKAISLDVTDSVALDVRVKEADVVVSLIPYTFHATVIKSAIREKKNVVTTSYVSPSMLELEKEVKEAGITVMNEIGVSQRDFFHFSR